MTYNNRMKKRLAVLCLSFSTIIAFGYALGGLGSWAMGRPRPFTIAAGLAAGCLCAWLALKIWKVYITEIEQENEMLRQAEKHAADSESKKDRED